MGKDPGEVGPQQLDDSQKTPEQLRAEIDETREDLGETVEALAAKTDVKARARERADELKSTAVHKKDELLSKVKPSSRPGADGSAPAGEPAAAHAAGSKSVDAKATIRQIGAKARENPVPTAALAAFIGGAAFGRLISRP
jgi:hypothetical protein